MWLRGGRRRRGCGRCRPRGCCRRMSLRRGGRARWLDMRWRRRWARRGRLRCGRRARRCRLRRLRGRSSWRCWRCGLRRRGPRRSRSGRAFRGFLLIRRRLRHQKRRWLGVGKLRNGKRGGRKQYQSQILHVHPWCWSHVSQTEPTTHPLAMCHARNGLTTVRRECGGAHRRFDYFRKMMRNVSWNEQALIVRRADDHIVARSSDQRVSIAHGAGYLRRLRTAHRQLLGRLPWQFLRL
jgi:hypothetical protein